MKIAIIGAGAAGCFAAANIASDKATEVVIFEKTGKALQKVKVSGGGRCNVTHACFDIPELIKHYPRGKRLLKKSLYRFSPKDTITWFENRGVSLKQEADGRVFPVTDSSQSIIDCLMDKLRDQNVIIEYNKAVISVKKEEKYLHITFKDGSSYIADRVLISTGGFPKKEQYNLITDLGHKIEQPAPSLFTFNLPGNPITKLMGVTVSDVSLKIQGEKLSERGPLLITHWGISGPVVLKASAWSAKLLQQRDYRFTVLISWLTDMKEDELRSVLQTIRQDKGKLLIQYKNPFELPKRLWEFLLVKAGVEEDVKWGELPAKSQNRLIQILLNDDYEVSGKTTFKEEFVTCGGVELSEIQPETMESRIVKGLYFAGEIMNVDGITGGFNFQHAWSSGIIAAEAMVKDE